METLHIQITNEKAVGLLNELVALHIIKIIKDDEVAKPKLSTKYKGIISKEQGLNLDMHIKQMRNEWSNI